MTYLLDTNAWITYLRGKDPRFLQTLHQVSPDQIALCAIVLAELIHGAHKSGPANASANLDLIAQLRARFACLPFDEPAAEWWGESATTSDSEGSSSALTTSRSRPSPWHGI